MVELNGTKGLKFEKLLGPHNFTSCNILTNLGFKDLDSVVLQKVKSSSPKTYLKKKLATHFVGLHLDQQNFMCFVKKPMVYKPKNFWDSICDHYATKSLKNVVNQMDRLYNIPFSNCNLHESINQFQEIFKLLLEVSNGNLDPTTIETLWAIIILKHLPSSFAVMQSLQFTQYKGKSAKIPMDTFLSNLEQEIKHQNKYKKSSKPSAFNLNAIPINLINKKIRSNITFSKMVSTNQKPIIPSINVTNYIQSKPLLNTRLLSTSLNHHRTILLDLEKLTLAKNK